MTVLDDLERLLAGGTRGFPPPPWRTSRFGNEPPTRPEAELIVALVNNAEALIRVARAAERLGFTSTESPLYEALEPLTKEDV